MEFNDELKQKSDAVNEAIERYLPKSEGKQKLVIEAMNYSVKAGGKRIRPLIMSETYKLCGGTMPEIVEPFMAALECIHTYSLVHDDLPAMDNDDYRRGQLTTHKKFGEAFGILAGDALLNYAFELMLNAAAECDSSDTSQRCVRAASVIAKKSGIYGMVGGQTLDIQLTDKEMSASDLEFIFDLKTAALIEAAFMAGAILAGADDKVINELEKAGRLVGTAFQIKDDILDVTATYEVLGKPVFSDERNNKTTYVTLYGMENAVKAVEDMSSQAVLAVKAIGSECAGQSSVFLTELILKLINREK